MAIGLQFPRWIGVVCADLEAQRHFYHDILGLREADRGEDWIQFDMGPGVTFEIIAQSSDAEYDQPRYQVGFAVEDIQSAREELLSRGVQVVSDIKGSNSYWAYFRDPEGNVFEVTERH
jgi:catechol 2,3-dioxygenase-like lactoylglutathione lyase family enzyme